MSDFNLSKLMEGKTPQSVMLQETRGLRNKWEKTGLLEGLKGEREQSQVAVLLENQAKQLLDEASATGTTGNSEEWSGVALPLVRRIFGEIAAKEFVSVQPMNLPSGLIFYLDFKYGTDQPGNPSFVSQSVYGGDSNGKLGSTNTASNGFYGDGRFAYTANDQNASAAFANYTVTTASWADVNFDSRLSASIAAGVIGKVIVTGSNVFTRPDYDAARSFYVSGAGFAAADSYFPAHTVGDSTNSLVTFYIQYADINLATSSLSIDYTQQPVDTNRGDFEDTNPTEPATDIGIPEIDLELRSEPIVAKTRKLKAVWTPELAQDLNAYHSVDAEAELTSMLSEYISLDIDLEILDMLKNSALTTEYWSATIGEEYNSVSQTWSAASTGVAYQKNTWYQTLGVKLNKVSNKIHQLTLRGGANFVVASPDVCTILESIPGFTVNAGKDAMEFAAGVTTVGALNNRYTVYKNPYMTSNEILMGFKGNNFLETGAVYAPYVPLIMTPLVYDPTNFTPRRGVMTRYAKKMVRPEFYGRIFVKDLASV